MGNTFSKVGRINEILKETIHSIENNREEISEIVEYAREDVKRIERELYVIQEKVDSIIKEVDKLEIDERKSRGYLSNVSKNYSIYSEEDFKEAYDRANEYRIRLLLKREEEKGLIERRMEQEVRLKSAIEVYEKAENVRKSVSVVTEYLKGNLDEIMVTVDHLSKRQILGIKIIEAQEEERERLARDIHDGPAQSMANILVKAELSERLMEIDRKSAKNELVNLKGIVRSTLKDLRKTIYDLRPMSLDDLGLVPTLERYILNFEEYTSIGIELNIIGNVIHLNPAIEIAVFRIVQESLNNIFKHSQASEAQVILEYSPRRLNLTVVDNGVGFEHEKVSKIDGDVIGGFGLISIKERVELLDGKMEIKSKLGQGTRIMVHIMLLEEED